MNYITVSDVDAALGDSWATADKKANAVMLANVWLTNKKAPTLALVTSTIANNAAEVIPPAISDNPVDYQAALVAAGSVIAADVSTGKLFGAKETGLQVKLVKAGPVESAKHYFSNATSYTAGEVQASAILQYWLDKYAMQTSGVLMLTRM